MPTQVNDILGLMLGLIVLLILIKHSLPSLSRLFKEKIMGISPSESFDLDELIQKKINLYKVEQAESLDLYEKNLQLNHKTQTLEFVHALSWDSKRCHEELQEKAEDLGLKTIPNIKQINRTYEQLKAIKGFEDGQALELENLKIFILFYSIFFPQISPEQRKKLYLESNLKLLGPELDIKQLIETCQADFSSVV